MLRYTVEIDFGGTKSMRMAKITKNSVDRSLPIRIKTEARLEDVQIRLLEILQWSEKSNHEFKINFCMP